MENFEKQFKISRLLLDNGWTVKSVSFTRRCEIVAVKNYIEVKIYTEECVCHGGRIWINCDHIRYYNVIEHDEYDEELGIYNSDTELKWEIENELIPELNKLNSFIYKVCKINQYSDNIPEKQDINYFNSFDSMSRFVTGNTCEDINTINIGESITVTFPNPDIREIITKIHKESKYSWEKNKIWFKVTRQSRQRDSKEDFKTEREYELYVDIFNK